MEQYLGRKVKEDIVNAYGVTIVPAHSTIDREVLELIVKHRVNEQSIVLETDEEKPEPQAADDRRIAQCVRHLKELYENIRLSRKVPIWEIRNEILPFVIEASDTPDVFQLLERVKGKDDYTYEHHIGVAVLSSLIGRWMNLGETELSLLSLAALLHDIGKIKIPDELLMKPGKLTEEEMKIVRKHTVYGYEMLRETKGVNHRVALVALQHHEREGGGGYPFGLGKDKIDPLSSIVAVADVFHAMSSKRPYRDPYPFNELLRQMRQEKFGGLSPQIVTLFLDNLFRRLVGQQVVLTDGRSGEVVYVNPNAPELPLIRIGGGFIDLSREREAEIGAIATG
ncbi:HD-GYP domain-containing protein [Cohnella thermotolerans]|uniref:HD-GYP domain-containing protein n=1 Tax=Cohnella thermotolerans TaxID=329858 RepID=UPI00041F60D6|nr:HD-GYP domain-containing protein [Cohnella thermotolerans]